MEDADYNVDDDSRRTKLSARLEEILDRTESTYLKILRAMLLLIATGLIIYAIVLSVSALYKIVQSPDSVEEEIAAVQPEELTGAELPEQRRSSREQRPAVTAHQRRAYAGLLARYHQLYRSRFEPFKQRDDDALTRAEFDARFLESQARLSAVGEGRLEFQNDIDDLNTLLDTMEAAAVLPATRHRLQRYRNAKKVQVCRNVERTRTTYVAGWDAYSTSCPNWYENMGCSVQRAVQTPYTARQCSMQFPEGTQSHQQIFRAYQDHFYSLLNSRRRENRDKAENERMNIIDGIAEGKMNLWTALTIVGAFLILMFFFLLIAIERHQRRVSSALRTEVGDQE